MGGVVNTIKDAFSSAIDAVEVAATQAWDYAVVPTLEKVFALLNIVDTTVVDTQKVSIPIYENNTVDVVYKAKVKAAISMTQEGGSFFGWYMQYSNLTKTQIKSFYLFSENDRYEYPTPLLQISGGAVDYTETDLALNDALGFSATRLSVKTNYPTDETYFKDKFQVTPYFYIPWKNTLTFTDPYGEVKTDYTFDSIIYNIDTDTYSINISRTAEQALFWITGPTSVPEGTSATYKVKCNRAVPAGQTIDIALAYTGTAPSGDYTAITLATITEGNTEVDVTVATVNNADADGSRTIIVTIASVDNIPAIFESVGIHTLNSVTTTITDNESLILTLPSIIAYESVGSVTVSVILAGTAGAAFTVDYALSNGTAIGGPGSDYDFDNTPGTLSFTGTDGEIQNITIPITADIADDNETFNISFNSSSDATVDITRTATIVISDSSSDPSSTLTTTLNDIITESGYTKSDSLIVTYHADTNPSTEWFYWIYKFSDGTYANLGNVTNSISNMEMLPIVVLRRDKVNINNDKTTSEYKKAKTMLSVLGFDIDSITDNVSSADNPGVSDVDDIFLNFSISPTLNIEVVSKALWVSFYNIIVINNVTSNTDEYTAIFSGSKIENANVWKTHTYTAKVSGAITNEYEHEIVYIPEIQDINGVVTQEASTNLYIKKKIDSTNYEEIMIESLNGMASVAYAGYSKVIFNKLGDENFTIPVSYYIINQLSSTEQMELYQYMLRIDAYSIAVTNIEWYQTSSFAALFQFTMIVVTIISLGSASGPLAALEKLITNYIVMELVVYLAELTGNAEFAAIVGFVTLIALGQANNTPIFDFTTAEGLINVSTNFADTLTTAYTTVGNEIRDDLAEINTLAESRLKEIKDAAPDEQIITSEFLVALKSVDTTVFPAVKAQYDFDLVYNYDMLIADYYDLNLKTGVV